MKKFFKLLPFCITTFMLSVYAHSGRTDANGGHWDRKNGTYHYHYDNDIDMSVIFLIIEFSVIALVLLYFIIISPVIEWFSERSPKSKLNKYSDSVDNLLFLKREIAECETILSNAQSNLIIPKEYEIGSDGLPKEIGSNSWGDTFTLYKSFFGEKLHSKYDCCGAIFKHHVYEYRQHANNPSILCQKCCCNYSFPPLEWYKKYLICNSYPSKLEKLKEQRYKLRKEVADHRAKCNAPLFRLLLGSNKKKKLAEIERKYKLL